MLVKELIHATKFALNLKLLRIIPHISAVVGAASSSTSATSLYRGTSLPNRSRISTRTTDKGGASNYSLGMMVKCMMLQKWFNLSDPMLAEMLDDRISFRRFVGLKMEQAALMKPHLCCSAKGTKLCLAVWKLTP